jgi:peptidoglycan/xylan/chitin deacetylase (PgdA/CDA1 family)
MTNQDLSALIFYYLGYSRMRDIIFRWLKKPVARFVTFHDIPHGSIAPFRAKLEFLKQHAHVISMEDYFAGKLSLAKVNVVITFDDGYKSWINQAVPALKQLGLPAIFFISSGFVGLSREEQSRFIHARLKLHVMGLDRNCTGALEPADVARIAQAGFTIGGHTLTHCNLEEEDMANIPKEIAQDKACLQAWTGQEIACFSYPFGAYKQREKYLVEVLKQCGYRGALTTVPGFNTPTSDPYLLRRDLTFAWMSEKVYEARVYGNHDPLHFLKRNIPMAIRR